MNRLASTPVPSRVVHGLAVATVVAALPLLLLGAEVTTRGVGMVDPVAVRSPWFFLAEWMNDHGLGWLIEHGHRQVGWIVGMLAIANVVAAFALGSRSSIRWLSVATLSAVIVQGLLGIFRIHLHALFGNNVALVHGAFAPVVLSLLLTLAVRTSRSWRPAELAFDQGRRLRIWCVVAVAATYLQLVLGGFIRHKDLLVAGRLHLLTAFVVFAFAWIVIQRARQADAASFRGLSRWVMALLTVQILLGAEAWMAWMKRHFLPALAGAESTAVQLTRSAHYVVGAFLFATLVVMAVKAFGSPIATQAVGLEDSTHPTSTDVGRFA